MYDDNLINTTMFSYYLAPAGGTEQSCLIFGGYDSSFGKAWNINDPNSKELPYFKYNLISD